MNVSVDGDDFTISLPQREFLLLTDALEEYLLIRGDRFDLLGFSRDQARAFATELAERTGAAWGAADATPTEGIE